LIISGRFGLKLIPGLCANQVEAGVNPPPPLTSIRVHKQR
jgi:hypothetical protein